MSARRLLGLLLAALVVLSGAFYLTSLRHSARDPHGAPLLAGLAAGLDAVTGLGIRKAAPPAGVHLRKQADRWTVVERDDYPADVTKLRKLLLALGDATVIEEKTSDPASYAIIGVAAPGGAGSAGAAGAAGTGITTNSPAGAPGAAGTVIAMSSPPGAGTEITIDSKAGTQAVIIGKPAGNGTFARRADEAQSVLVEPAISADAEPRDWIDARIGELPLANIERIELKPAAGPGYVLRRLKSGGAAAGAAPPAAAPGAEEWSLDAVPAGRKALNSASLAPSPLGFGTLTAEDVAPASGIDVSRASIAVVTLTDGNVITLTGAVAGDRHWLEWSAAKDSAPGDRTLGRAYEIAADRYDAIFRPLETLLQPKPAPPPARPKPAKHASAAAP